MEIAGKTVDEAALAAFCERHGIRSLSLFGSTLRGDDGPGSDIDLLVQFEPGTRLGLSGLARLEAELSQLFGKTVDLRSPADLSRYFRDKVQDEAKPLYAA